MEFKDLTNKIIRENLPEISIIITSQHIPAIGQLRRWACPTLT